MFMQKVKICTTRNVQFPPGFEKRNRRGEEEESFSSQRTQCREQESHTHTHISLIPHLFSRQQIKIDSGVFGAQAPIMVPDKSVTMCQVCSTLFTFTFRRHHCRGCGKVVCGSCSQWKAFLRYLKKSERICEKCYNTSKSESGEEVTAAASSPKTSRRKEGSGGILDLKGYEEDTIKGGYVLSQDGRSGTASGTS
ncbi:FYVE, RhoGEF and PH domain-containing protein 6 [Geodia barretti]|uniref:FYVE, RhoGEF and PH domain-containing protein 6 n=1 Tax=Geodia barretti TaxID=519541 RepID=A0AA35T3T5_GEOBA|nr:FYVE, RhoGEF and PH domain-containing protein 6 [Geodia barretti]